MFKQRFSARTRVFSAALRFLSVFLFVASPVVSCRLCADEKPMLLHASIDVSPVGSLIASAHLGDLESDKKIDFELIVTNRTKKPIEFTKFSVACSCLKATTQGDKIPEDGELKITGTLKTPSDARIANASTALFLETDAGKRVTIRLDYKLTGLLSFVSPSAMFRSIEGNPNRSFRIPIIASSPVLPENIVVSLSSELSHLKAKIVSDQKDVFVECTLKSDVSAAGTVTITDSVTKRSAFIPCVIDREPAITVSPSILYFLPSKEKKNLYSATSIISISKGFLQFKGEDRQVELPVDLSCTVEGWSVKLETKRLGLGIYRVTSTVELERRADEKSEPLPTDATWTARTGTFHLNARSTVKIQ